ncbi:pentatricopeptide repeat-containing protein At1g06143-like [Malus domestica]|uniref:pentatricopeptide repeat-containing protein At1g06143-like n=1 Tax=Malus domestica TaxID=3750 RepID=UPI0039768937
MIFCTDPSLGNFDYAEKVFHFIKDLCLFVYDEMIKAFAKRSSFRSVVELFRRLREEGLCPYNFTKPFVLKPLDAWERFGKVFDEIPERNKLCWNLELYDFEFGMKPDDFTFIVVLTDCVHRGLVDEGWEFFNSIRKIYEIE